MDMLETILQYLENGYRNMRKIYRFEDILPEHQFDDTASVLVQSLNTAGFQKQFSSKEAVKYYCLGKWREFKTAYSIHSEFLKALSWFSQSRYTQNQDTEGETSQGRLWEAAELPPLGGRISGRRQYRKDAAAI